MRHHANLVPIGQTVAEISRFLDCSKWRMTPFWIFNYSNFLHSQLSRRSNCLIVPNLVKIARTAAEIWQFFFRFFKMAAAAILDLWNFKFLMVWAVKRVDLHHHAKFRQNRSNRGRDMAFFIIFPRWRSSATLDLWCVWWDHPRRAFGGLYHCAKFGWNRCSSFDNMHLFSISRVWLENAYSRPKIGVLGFFDPFSTIKGQTPSNSPNFAPSSNISSTSRNSAKIRNISQ